MFTSSYPSSLPLRSLFSCFHLFVPCLQFACLYVYFQAECDQLQDVMKAGSCSLNKCVLQMFNIILNPRIQCVCRLPCWSFQWTFHDARLVYCDFFFCFVHNLHLANVIYVNGIWSGLYTYRRCGQDCVHNLDLISFGFINQLWPKFYTNSRLVQNCLHLTFLYSIIRIWPSFVHKSGFTRTVYINQIWPKLCT